MRKSFGALLIAFALFGLLFVTAKTLNVSYWTSPPKEKFMRSWKDDVALLAKNHQLPDAWNQVKEIKLATDNSPAQDWIVGINPPIVKHDDGKYRLDIFVIHWIEGTRYGALLQYNLVDLSNNNTIWELDRTLKLGYIY